MAGSSFWCGLDAALAVVGGKWKPLIVWALRDRPMRTGELRREVQGISERVLIQQVRELERDGVVARTVFHQVPPRVEYALTEAGAALNAALDPLCAWGEAHLDQISARCADEAVRPAG